MPVQPAAPPVQRPGLARPQRRPERRGKARACPPARTRKSRPAAAAGPHEGQPRARELAERPAADEQAAGQPASAQRSQAQGPDHQDHRRCRLLRRLHDRAELADRAHRGRDLHRSGLDLQIQDDGGRARRGQDHLGAAVHQAPAAGAAAGRLSGLARAHHSGHQARHRPRRRRAGGRLHARLPATGPQAPAACDRRNALPRQGQHGA